MDLPTTGGNGGGNQCLASGESSGSCVSENPGCCDGSLPFRVHCQAGGDIYSC